MKGTGIRIYKGKFIERPIDNNGFADDKVFGNEAPGARIVTNEAIVAEDKVLIGWNSPHLASEIGGFRDIGFIELDIIDPEMIEISFDCIAREADDAQDIIGCTISIGIMKHNHITACGPLEQVRNFVDHHVLIFLQAGRHSNALNLVALDDKTEYQKDKKTKDEDLDDLAFQV